VDKIERIQNNSLEKSLNSSNFIIEELKEEPKDVNNKTISTIARESERNVNKMNEICNKIENITFIEKVVSNSTVGTTQNNNLGKINVETDMLNRVLFDNNQYSIKPITSFNCNKISKNAKHENVSDCDLLKKFGNKLKGSINKMLNEKFSKLKEKNH